MCTIPKAAALGGQRVKDYRGVLVASVVGKKLHSFWRKGLDPILARRAAGTMCGGIAGRATDIASHIARLTIARAKARSHSVALLFADLVSAFDSVLRQYVMRAGDDEEAVAQLASMLKLPATALHDLTRELAVASAFDESDVPAQLHHVVAEAHADSWIHVGDAQDLMTTWRGSKPGDPFGDVVFNFFMMQSLALLSAELLAEGLTCTMEYSPGAWQLDGGARRADINLVDVSYVDDALFAMMVPLATQLIDVATRAAAIVQAFFRRRSMLLNFSRGKTEALLVPCGVGARRVRQKVALAEGTAEMHDEAGTNLVITQRYKHLGGVLDVADRIAPELRRRAGAAYAGYHKVKRELVDGSLPEKARLLPVSTHVLSTLLYNAATWPRVTDREAAIVAGPYHKALRAVHLRRLDGTPKDASDLRCRLALRMPSVPLLLRQKRLVYLRRVALHAPDALRALLQDVEHHSRLFPSMIVEDVEWLVARLSLPPAATFAAAIALAVNFTRKAWASAVARAVTQDIDMHIAELAGQDPAAGEAFSGDDDAPAEAQGPQPGQVLFLPIGGEGTVVRRTSSACKVDKGGTTHWISLKSLGNPHLQHACIECDAVFGTASALASHRHRKHNIKNVLRFYVRGTMCLKCMLELHTRERHLYHLKKARACREYTMSQEPLTDVEVESLDAAARAEQRHNVRSGLQPRHAHLAAFRRAGPHPV